MYVSDSGYMRETIEVLVIRGRPAHFLFAHAMPRKGVGCHEVIPRGACSAQPAGGGQEASTRLHENSGKGYIQTNVAAERAVQPLEDQQVRVLCVGWENQG